MRQRLYELFFSPEISGYWALVWGTLNITTLIMLLNGYPSEGGLITHSIFGILFWIFFWVWIRHMIKALN